MKKKILIVLLIFFVTLVCADNFISLETISNVQMENEQLIPLNAETYHKVYLFLLKLLEIATNNIQNSFKPEEPFMYTYMIIHPDLSFTVNSKQSSSLLYDPIHPYANFEGYYWKIDFDYKKELENIAKIILLLQELESLDKKLYHLNDPALIAEKMMDILKLVEAGANLERTDDIEQIPQKPYSDDDLGVYSPDGFVPDEETAKKIAEAIWVPIYGDAVLTQKPYVVTLVDDKTWIVEGTLPWDYDGGTAYIEIDKQSGIILKVVHGK